MHGILITHVCFVTTSIFAYYKPPPRASRVSDDCPLRLELQQRLVFLYFHIQLDVNTRARVALGLNVHPINIMDILSHILPEGYYAPDIDIPYLPYDGVDAGSYAEYPRIRGFQMHQEMDVFILQVADNRSYAEYTSLLQSWLFFSFLREICVRFQKPFLLSKLVSFPNDGRPKITATFLSPSTWRSMRSIPFGGMGGLAEVLFITQHHAALFDFENPESAEESLDRALIVLSIKYLVYHIVDMILLGNYLSTLNLTVIEEEKVVNLAERIKEQRLMCGDSQESQQPSAMVMKRYLETNGWCPVLAEDLLRRRGSAASPISGSCLLCYIHRFVYRKLRHA